MASSDVHPQFFVYATKHGATRLREETPEMSDYQDLPVEGQVVSSEELMAMAAKLEKKEGSPSPSKSKSKKVTGQEWIDQRMPMVSSAIHVYQREGEPDAAVRTNANRERKMAGPSVIVFCHMHQYGLECTDSCKVKVED